MPIIKEGGVCLNVQMPEKRLWVANLYVMHKYVTLKRHFSNSKAQTTKNKPDILILKVWNVLYICIDWIIHKQQFIHKKTVLKQIQKKKIQSETTLLNRGPPAIPSWTTRWLQLTENNPHKNNIIIYNIFGSGKASERRFKILWHEPALKSVRSVWLDRSGYNTWAFSCHKQMCT